MFICEGPIVSIFGSAVFRCRGTEADDMWTDMRGWFGPMSVVCLRQD